MTTETNAKPASFANFTITITPEGHYEVEANVNCSRMAVYSVALAMLEAFARADAADGRNDQFAEAARAAHACLADGINAKVHDFQVSQPS